MSRDREIRLPDGRSLFEHIHEWQNAPSNTASAELAQPFHTQPRTDGEDTMTRFQKKPVIVEAVPVSEVLHNAGYDWKALPEWLRDAYERGEVFFAAEHVSIKTPEGDHRGDNDDWIIRGVKGELYPCKPDIFEATYEPVPDRIDQEEEK